MNNFDIKQKRHEICFIICHHQQTRSGKIKTNKIQQISVKTENFFIKIELRHIQLQLLVKSFYIIFVDIFFLKSLTHEKINRI